MVPQVYLRVKTECFAALEPLFPVVQSPIEAPEKTTYGDIDILVCLEGSSYTQDEINDPQKRAIWAKAEEALKAVRSVQQGKLAVVKSIAVPWPAGVDSPVMAHQLSVEAIPAGKPPVDEADHGGIQAALSGDAGAPAVAVGSLGDQNLELKPRHVQVDVRMCLTRDELDWHCFIHNHGDLWGLLGFLIRPLGLVVDDKALYIRIPEVEQHHRKMARVFLTNKPNEVLDFLGLGNTDGEIGRPFPSVDEMFEYAARSRWFVLWPERDSSPGLDGGAGKGEGEAAAVKLKANDRARMRQRPIFARWVEEFLPARHAAGRFVRPGPGHSTRADVRKFAFAAFPGSEERYTDQLTVWNREKACTFVRNTIKKDHCIPSNITHILPALQEGSAGTTEDVEASWRGVLRSALAKIVTKDDGMFAGDGIVPPRLCDEHGVLIVEEVKEWIGKNWEEVARLAWRENCARAAEAYRIKKERERTKAEENAVTASASSTEKGENQVAAGSSASGSSPVGLSIEGDDGAPHA